MTELHRIDRLVAAGLRAVQRQQIDQARELLKETVAAMERGPDSFGRKTKADVAELALAICRAHGNH